MAKSFQTGVNVFGTASVIGSLSANSASIISTSSATVPMTIIAASGQTGNIQEWKNSSGTVMSSIRFDGLMSVGGSGLITSTIRSISGTGGRINLSGNNPITIDTTSSVVIPLIVKSTASQTVDIQQWQNDSSSVIMSVSASTTPLVVRNVQSATYVQQWLNSGGSMIAGVTLGGAVYGVGGLQLPSTAYISNSLTGAPAIGNMQFSTTGPIISTSTASNVTLRVIAASAQSANIQEWQNSAGTNLVNITNGGYVNGTGFIGARSYINSGINAAYTSFIQMYDITSIGLAVRAVASATADLTQWQNSSGSVIMSVSSSTTPLIIKNIQGSANIQEWRDVNNNILSYIRNDGLLIGQVVGTLYTTAINNTTSGNNAQIQPLTTGTVISTSISTNVSLTVRNLNASATTDLQRWQNSSGSVLASITASGGANFASASISGSVIATQAWVQAQGYSTGGGGSSASTGTGSTVYNTSPTLLGTVSASNLTVNGNLTTSVGTTTLGYTNFVSSNSTGVLVTPSSPLIKLTNNTDDPNAYGLLHFYKLPLTGGGGVQVNEYLGLIKFTGQIAQFEDDFNFFPAYEAEFAYIKATPDDVTRTNPKGRLQLSVLSGASITLSSSGVNILGGGTNFASASISGSAIATQAWVQANSGGVTTSSTSFTSTSIASSSVLSTTMPIGKTFIMSRLTTNIPARIRMYASTATRNADVDRAVGTTPTGNHGLILEMITTTGILDYYISPAVIAYVSSSSVPINITNLSASSGSVTINLTRSILEQ